MKRTCLPSPIGLGSAKLASSSSSDTGGLPRPNGARQLELLGELHVQLLAPHDGVDALDVGQVRPAGSVRSACAQNAPRRHPAGRARSPARRRRGARRRRAGAPRTPSAPPSRSKPSMLRPEPRARSPSPRDQHHRAPAALDQARGDDPDHARVPALAGEHVGRAARRARPSGLRPRGGCRARRDGARGWRRRARGRPARRATGSLGEQQLERRVGAVQAPGGVQPRREREADRALADPRRLHPARPPSARAARASTVRASARRPRRTSVRFSPSSGTTSAIVASATRSSLAHPSSALGERARRERRVRRSDDAPARACRRPPWRTARGTGSRTRAGCTIGASRQRPVRARAWWSVTTHLDARARARPRPPRPR